MTTITLDPVLLAYVFGLGLMAFSLFRKSIFVYLAIMATMFGVVVAGDQGTVGEWPQVGAILMMVWSGVQLFRGLQS